MSSRTLHFATLVAFPVAALLVASYAAPPLAFAQATPTPTPTPTAVAKAVIKDTANVTKGTVYLTEMMAGGTYVDHKINVKGRITGIPAGTYAVHLWQGPCSALAAHLDHSGQSHPLHTGDLPNVVAAGTPPVINLNELSITNRFTLGNSLLNLWGRTTTVSIAFTSGAADGQESVSQLVPGPTLDPDAGTTPPSYCGEVRCDPTSANCFEPQNN